MVRNSYALQHYVICNGDEEKRPGSNLTVPDGPSGQKTRILDQETGRREWQSLEIMARPGQVTRTSGHWSCKIKLPLLYKSNVAG